MLLTTGMNYRSNRSVINKMISRTPMSDTMKRKSAAVSSVCDFFGWDERIEKKDKMLERDKQIATRAVNSSMLLVSDMLVIWNDVITKRQNPKRFTEVFRMCSDVFFAMGQ